MSHDRVLFDPATAGATPNAYLGPLLFGADDVTYGISFQRKMS